METVRETEYTKVVVRDEAGQGNACHSYEVLPAVPPAENEVSWVQPISFQNGPIKENGVNGAQNEDLLAIVIHRLKGFESGEFACAENADALQKCQDALLRLEDRTADRKERGVEGKNEA